MHLYFKHLSISNFLSFGDSVELDLSDKGYTLVSGENQNPVDNAKSNGSGKSALWEAIAWCLTGETLRGIRSDVINMYNAAEECTVTLTFSVDSDEYNITRIGSNKSSDKLFIKINGEDKSGKGIKDTEKLLKEYLPELTKDLIGAVVILGQGLPQRFSNNTPSGRKAILEKLSKSDFMIEDIKDKLSRRSDVLSNQLREVEDSLLKLTTQKESLVNALKKDKITLEQLPPSQTLEDSLKSLQEESQQLEIICKENKEAVVQAEDALRSLETTFANIENAKKSKQLELRGAEDTELNPLETEIYDCKYTIKTLTAEINRLEAIKDTCPTCGQKLVGVQKPDTTELRKRQMEAQNILQEKENQKKTISTKYFDEFLKIDTYYDSIKTRAEADLKCSRTTLNNLRLKSSTYESNLNTVVLNIKRKELELQNYVKNKEDLISTITNSEQVIAKIDEQILYNNKRRDDLLSRANVVNKMLTVAKRDFRGFLLTNIIDYIDRRAKEYARDVFESDKIEFKLDGNNLLIAYNNKPYENLSGGERQKVDIIVQFALRDMLCKFSAFSSNILVLDELFDGLDAYGCQKVIDLISKYLTDIESVFIITHHVDIAIPADNTIVVVKNLEGVSAVK